MVVWRLTRKKTGIIFPQTRTSFVNDSAPVHVPFTESGVCLGMTFHPTKLGKEEDPAAVD